MVVGPWDDGLAGWGIPADERVKRPSPCFEAGEEGADEAWVLDPNALGEKGFLVAVGEFVAELVFPPVRKGELETAFLSRTLNEPEDLRTLSSGGLSNLLRMLPKGEPASSDEMAESVDGWRCIPALVGPEAAVALLRKLRGGMVCPVWLAESRMDPAKGFPPEALHPLELRFLICSRLRAGLGGPKLGLAGSCIPP